MEGLSHRFPNNLESLKGPLGREMLPLHLLVWVAGPTHPVVCPLEGCGCFSPPNGRAQLSSV